MKNKKLFFQKKFDKAKKNIKNRQLYKIKKMFCSPPCKKPSKTLKKGLFLGVFMFF